MFDNLVPDHNDVLKKCKRWFDDAVQYILKTAAPRAEQMLLQHSREAEAESPGDAGEIILTQKVKGLLNDEFANALKCEFMRSLFLCPAFSRLRCSLPLARMSGRRS